MSVLMGSLSGMTRKSASMLGPVFMAMMVGGTARVSWFRGMSPVGGTSRRMKSVNAPRREDWCSA